MAIRMLCPNGHELIAQNEHVGRKVKCPACGVIMVVPNPMAAAVTAPPQPRPPQPPPPPPPRMPPPQPQRVPPPPPQAYPQAPPQAAVTAHPQRMPPAPPPQAYPEQVAEEAVEAYEEEERPRKQKGMKNRQRMRLANIGLAFHYAKLLCLIVALALLTFALVVTPLLIVSGAGRAFVTIMRITSLIGNILWALTPILGGVGSLLCFWVPEKARARVLIIVSFSLEVGSVVLVVLAFIALFGGAAATARTGDLDTAVGVAGMFLVMLLLSFAAYLAGFILFMLFLRALGKFVRDRMSAEDAIRQMILFLSVLVGGFIGLFAAGFALQRAGIAGAIVMLFLVIGWLVGLITVLFGILTLIGTLRQLIATRWG